MAAQRPAWKRPRARKSWHRPRRLPAIGVQLEPLVSTPLSTISPAQAASGDSKGRGGCGGFPGPPG